MKTLASYPDLGVGIVSDAISIATRLFNASLVAKEAQSNRYKIHSLPYAVQQSGESMSDLRVNVINLYTELYSTYYKEVDVNVDMEEKENGNVDMVIDIIFGDGAESSRLSESLFVSGGLIDRRNRGEYYE